ncbi:dihydrodipicolinate synthase family protein [Blastopirellula marina]|nr:dihydrodipicolinate synthase family protein [Blastopirellula marina]
MANKKCITRRAILKAAAASASGILAGSVLSRVGQGAESDSDAIAADPKVRGPFPILSTPFTEDGQVDYDVLAKEAKFVAWAGTPGMIWPQSADSVDLLTTDEKRKGMEVLAEATRGMSTALCLGVQGTNTEEMLEFAEHAEKLAPTAIISRPPDSGKTEEDLRQYWRALAAVATRPVILQTTGGVAYKGPLPSPQLMIELAEEFPHFGYIKEEAGDVLGRMKASLAARPPVRRVFSARGGIHWNEESRLGSEGVITERAAYADVLTRIWELQQSGEDPETLKDVFGKFLAMVKVKPGGLRDANLYIWKKRGVFKNLISRNYGPGKSFPASPIISEFKMNEEKIAEVEKRFEALNPYLIEVTPDLSKPA